MPLRRTGIVIFFNVDHQRLEHLTRERHAYSTMMFFKMSSTVGKLDRATSGSLLSVAR